MEEQGDFLSPKHKHMLNIAMWAKLLAWAALIFYIFRSGVVILEYQVSLLGLQAFSDPLQNIHNFLTLLGEQPYYMVTVVVAILSLLLRGTIFYLVLNGISLGLNMIVETDINYRDNKTQEGEP